MSSRPLLGEGTHGSPITDSEYIEQLRKEIRNLKNELVDQRTLVNERDAAVAALQAVQSQFEPWHKAINRLFDIFEEVGVRGGAPVVTGPANAQSSPVWQSWKSRLGGKASEFIDLLLIHREMTAAQIMAAAKCGKRTVYDVTYTMNKAGILSKNGSRYSLKDL